MNASGGDAVVYRPGRGRSALCAGDEWTITQDNDLVNTKPLCPAE